MSSNRRLFIKQIGMTAIGAGMLASFPDLQAFPASPLRLPRSTPEEQGVSSARLIAFLEAIGKSNIEFHSVMVLRNGNVIAEGWWNPYGPNLRHTLHSLSKSFTSTAVGMAIAEQHFSLDSQVISFFPNDLPPEPSENLKAMTVQHLLTMSCGHNLDAGQRMRNIKGKTWVKGFFSLPVEHAPGTKFVYNTGATFILSAIVQKKTGQSLMQYLKPRLFDPLGITGADWESDPQGINAGGFGLRVRTEDIAKFGQLYLQKGEWKGKALLSPEWVEDATSFHIQSNPAMQPPNKGNDWSQGYGYQFWRCRYGAYRGDGAFGQFCIVNPELNAVVAITGESFNMQASMNLVWSHVWPAMTKAKPLANLATQNSLREKLISLSYAPPQGAKTSPIAEIISGKVYTLDSNEFDAKSLSLTLANDSCLFKLSLGKSECEVSANFNAWKLTPRFTTQMIFPIASGRPNVSSPLAASVNWRDEKTLEMTLRFTESAHSDSFTFTFTGNHLVITFMNSVSRGNPKKTEEKRVPVHGNIL